MKIYTDKQKIAEIELGIRIINLDIKTLQLDISKARLCDVPDKLDQLVIYRKRIVNMELRIDQLDVNQW